MPVISMLEMLSVKTLSNMSTRKVECVRFVYSPLTNFWCPMSTIARRSPDGGIVRGQPESTLADDDAHQSRVHLIKAKNSLRANWIAHRV